MYQKSMSTVKTTKGKQDTRRYKLTNINGITSMKIVLNFLYFNRQPATFENLPVLGFEPRPLLSIKNSF